VQEGKRIGGGVGTLVAEENGDSPTKRRNKGLGGRNFPLGSFETIVEDYSTSKGVSKKKG